MCVCVLRHPSIVDSVLLFAFKSVRKLGPQDTTGDLEDIVLVLAGFVRGARKAFWLYSSSVAHGACLALGIGV